MGCRILSAGILVGTDLLMVSFVHPISPHLWKIWKERKVWFFWGRKIRLTADKRCYCEVPKVQYKMADIMGKAVTTVVFEDEGSQNWCFV